MKIKLYTDGSCKPNPGPGGYAYVIVPDEGPEVERAKGERATTNNRMELKAALNGLRYILNKMPTPEVVYVYTDSTYLKRGITEWIKIWQSNGWKTAGGGEVRNADLWRMLIEILPKIAITWHWIRGHDGDEYNERADELAVAARERASKVWTFAELLEDARRQDQAQKDEAEQRRIKQETDKRKANERLKNRLVQFFANRGLNEAEVQEHLHTDSEDTPGIIRAWFTIPEHAEIRVEYRYSPDDDPPFTHYCGRPFQVDGHDFAYFGNALLSARRIWARQQDIAQGEHDKQDRRDEKRARRAELRMDLDEARKELVRAVCDEYPILYSVLFVLKDYIDECADLQGDLEGARWQADLIDQARFRDQGQAESQIRELERHVRDLQYKIYDLERGD